MEQKKPIFRMTAHCRMRYYERVLNEPWNGFCKFEKEIWAKFKESEENVQWVNNKLTVEYFKKKLGHCKVKIFKNKELDLVFVCERDKEISNLFFIKTCFYPTTSHYI